jgi:hypothetical protein
VRREELLRKQASSIAVEVDELPTYGYRHVHAILKRQVAGEAYSAFLLSAP